MKKNIIQVKFSFYMLLQGIIFKFRAAFDIGQKWYFFNEKRELFLKIVPQTPPPPYSLALLSVLHQNKALHSFRKMGQRSIVELNVGLEYVLFYEKYFLKNWKLNLDHMYEMFCILNDASV